MTSQICLSVVCEQYKTLHYYEGIVELSLSAATHVDPRNLGLHFYKTGQPLGDTHGQQALSDRYAGRLPWSLLLLGSLSTL